MSGDVFPRVGRGRVGYCIKEVDHTLSNIRAQYENYDLHSNEQRLTTSSIRTIAFSMQKNGYSPSHVDVALERLEDAIAHRTKKDEVARIGERAYMHKARELAAVILARAQRIRTQKFKRTSILTKGYCIHDVDTFCTKVESFLQGSSSMSLTDVRSAAFRPRYRGYAEYQVDAFCDSIIEFMLSIR